MLNQIHAWLPHLIYLGVAAAALYAFWRFYFKDVWARAQAYSKNIATCGYLAPPPTERASKWLRRFAWCLSFAQVGTVRVHGRENLEALERSGKVYMLNMNHPSWMDPAMAAIVMDGRPTRFFATHTVATAFWGLGGLLVGPCGVISVDLARGKGHPAYLAGVQVLKERQRLIVFPSGWAKLDGIEAEHKTGVVRMAKEVSAALGEPVYMLPGFIRYGRYPGSWIVKWPAPIGYFFMFVFRSWYRNGAVVNIGKPISSADLPDDPHAAKDLLHDRIMELDPGRSN